MSIAKIRAAFETRLATLSPALATAYENGSYAPVAGTPYQRVNLLPNTPEDAVLGSKIYFERGIFQVTLCYPVGNGPGTAEARAQLVKDLFKRGTSMTQSGLIITVMRAPSAAPAFIDGDRYCIPLSVRYQAQVSP